MTIEFADIEQRVEVPRDGNGKPLVIPKAGGKPVALARTTTFIDCIEDKSNLAKWGKRMVLVAAVKEPGIVSAAEGLDHENPEDKTKLDALVERMLQAAGANDKRDKGSELHAYTELVDAGQPLPDTIELADMLDMAEYAMATDGFQFSHVEQFVVCSELGVGGTPDRIVYYEGPGPEGRKIKGWFIWDLKTGAVEYGGLKMAAQLGIYSRAEFYDHTLFPAPDRYDSDGKETKEWKAWKSREYTAEEIAAAYTPIPKVNQKWGIIMHMGSGTSESGLYWVDLTIGWKAAKLAKLIREMRSLSRRALTKFAEATSVTTTV